MANQIPTCNSKLRRAAAADFQYAAGRTLREECFFRKRCGVRRDIEYAASLVDEDDIKGDVPVDVEKLR